MKPAWISGIIVLVLAGYLGYNTVYLKGRQELSKFREQLRQHEQTQELRKQVARSLDEVERLRKRLPPEPDTEWLVREVGKLAEEAGVRLTSIIPQNPKALHEFTQLSVSLQFGISYHQLGKFLSAIENAKLFIHVDDLEMTRGQDGSQSALVRMTLSTWYVPPLAKL